MGAAGDLYQHPLAYVLGLEGLALLRAWAGDYDEAFVRERLDEVRRLLDDPVLAGHPGIRVRRGTTRAAYAAWASTYDQPNTLFDIDEPVLAELLDPIPPGRALDAACGTGRLAAMLVERGHEVIAVDSSPEMLDAGRAHRRGIDFRLGDLHALPLEDGAVDLVVSGLALAHVPDLAPVFAELARVVRPGGNIVISDTHHELVLRGSVVKAPGPNGEPGLVETYRHPIGAFVRAAVAAGLHVRRCEEPIRARPPSLEHPAPAPSSTIGAMEDWPWTLLPLIPAAAEAAWAIPAVVVWQFQRPA